VNTNATIDAIEALNDTLVVVTITPDDRTYKHRAGQYTVVTLEGPDGRDLMGYFSIASPPFEAPRLQLLVRLTGGDFTAVLAELKCPARCGLAEPAGSFACATTGDLLMVGGGTGVAPLLAMLRQAQHDGWQGEAKLIYGARNFSELGFVRELEAMVNEEFLDAVFFFSDRDGPIELDAADITERTQLHTCGPKPMIASILEQAKGLGLRDEHAHVETY
jgi:ferredoxin-NADP reductase